MTAPSCRTEQIEQLISTVDRYNPNNCHLLEDYLDDQLADNSYDLIANLALLKLYQFNPSLLNTNSALSSLFLSLVHAPFAPDFALNWSLLSDSFAVGAALPPPAPSSDSDSEHEASSSEAAVPKGEREAAERLLELSTLVHGRKFNQFWATLRQGHAQAAKEAEVKSILTGLTGAANGFEATLRDQIAAEVESTFVGLAAPVLRSFLGLASSDAELEKIAEARGWKVEGETVKLPKNESNSPASTLQREKIEIDQLQKLLGRTQA